MKRTNYHLLLILFISSVFSATAQHFNEPAGYLDFINDHHREIAQEIVFYTNTLAHGKSAKKEEPVRKAILHKLKSASFRIGGMPDYKSDKSLQDSLVSYTRATYSILDTEYPKIAALQDSATKSYETAKHYAQAQDEALNLLIKDEDKFVDALAIFAGKYGVPVSDKHDDEYEQLQTIRSVSKYYHTIYLAYFRSQIEEAHLSKAIEKKDKQGVEKHTAALSAHVKEGLITVDTAKAYKEDKSLAAAAKQVLEFYQKEIEFKLPTVIGFLTKNETYTKTKKEFAEKSNKSQEEIEQFNKETAEYNDLVIAYPRVIQDLNEERPKALANWNKMSHSYLKKNLPSL